MNIILVDSHCHLHLVDKPLDEILTSAQQAGVEHLLCVATELADIPTIQAYAELKTDPTIYFSIGIHPNHACGRHYSAADLLPYADHPKMIAIGETGLDYFRSEGSLDWQRERFMMHIEVAKSVQKPLIVHTRHAAVDTIAILQTQGAEAVGGVMHCFCENWDIAKAAMDLGFYISFSGIITFKNALEVQALVKQVPLDRLLIETDCPYLAPVPYRGKTNEPAYVRYVAECVAELKNISVEAVAEASTHNFKTLFKI